VEGASHFMHNEIGIDFSKGPSAKKILNQVFSLGKASAMDAYCIPKSVLKVV
jgi:hypothetical protein